MKVFSRVISLMGRCFPLPFHLFKELLGSSYYEDVFSSLKTKRWVGAGKRARPQGSAQFTAGFVVLLLSRV